MAWVVTKVRLKREGVYAPSGSTLNMTDDERDSLVPAYARDATEAEIAEASALAPGQSDLMVSPEAIDAALSGLSAQEKAEIGGEPESRVAEVKDALDLLDAADFVDGVPSAAKLAEVLGYEATADEIAAALALREAL